MQQGFVPIRGVQFWVDNGLRQTYYKWKCLTGPPPTNWITCFRPLAPSVQPLGDRQVAWYKPGNGNFFGDVHLLERWQLRGEWAMGRLPPGKVRWARW